MSSKIISISISKVLFFILFFRYFIRGVFPVNTKKLAIALYSRYSLAKGQFNLVIGIINDFLNKYC